MTLRIPACALLTLTALLCACGDSENAPGPGGVSMGEARALDDAAEMVERQPSIPDDGATDDEDAGDETSADDQVDEAQ